MVMSGHSHTSRDGHAKHILALARQIMYTLDDMDPVSGWRLRVRIGVHTGPVVAAVAGGISCRYFVLGRTMLVAQQISESVSPMSIAISAATRDALHKIEPDAVRDFYELGRVTIRGNSLQVLNDACVHPGISFVQPFPLLASRCWLRDRLRPCNAFTALLVLGGLALQVWGQQIRNWEEARLITPGSEYLLSSRTIEILQASVYVLSERVEDLLAISAQSQSSHLLAGAGGLGKADVSHLQDLLEKTASVVAALQHHTSTSSLNGFEVEAAKPILLGESLEQFREQAVVGGGSGPVSSHLLAEADKVLEPLAACKRKVQDKQKQMDLDARMLADMETTGEPSQPRNEFQGGPDDLSFCVDKPAAMEDHAADRSTPNIEAERLSDSNCTTSPSNRDRLDALPSSSSSNTRPTAPSDAALLAFLKDIGMERYYETLHIHEVDVPMLLKKQQPSDLAEVGLQHPSGQQQLFQAMHQDATLSYPEGEAVVPSADSLHAQTRQAGDDS